MDRKEIIEQIKQNVQKNKGEWDLTNDDGNPIVYCYQKNVHIPNLALNKDNEVCALVPLQSFADETLLNVLEIM